MVLNLVALSLGLSGFSLEFRLPVCRFWGFRVKAQGLFIACGFNRFENTRRPNRAVKSRQRCLQEHAKHTRSCWGPPFLKRPCQKLALLEQPP